MRTELAKITPKTAAEWLRLNTSNRPIRPSHVETLRLSFARGEYRPTHQGIAFDEDGVLIDGQHRLTAISMMPDGFSCQMLVTRGLIRSEVYPVVDGIQAKRSVSDNLSIDRNIGETANFLAKLYLGASRGLTPTYVAPFVRFVEPHVLELLSFCNTRAKTWSSGPVRAAAVISMKYGDADYVKLVYRSLIVQDFNSMPRVVQALFRGYLAGTVTAGAWSDFYARCLRAFDPLAADNTRIQVKDASAAIQETRTRLSRAIPELAHMPEPPGRRSAPNVRAGKQA